MYHVLRVRYTLLRLLACLSKLAMYVPRLRGRFPKKIEYFCQIYNAGMDSTGYNLRIPTKNSVVILPRLQTRGDKPCTDVLEISEGFLIRTVLRMVDILWVRGIISVFFGLRISVKPHAFVRFGVTCRGLRL